MPFHKKPKKSNTLRQRKRNKKLTCTGFSVSLSFIKPSAKRSSFPKLIKVKHLKFPKYRVLSNSNTFNNYRDLSDILRSQQIVNLQENCFEQQRSGIEGIQSTPLNSNQSFLKGSM